MGKIGVGLVDDQDVGAVHLPHREQKVRRQIEGPGQVERFPST